MSASLRHKIMTLEDFLAWEARQETKFEFDGFEPFAMTGGSLRHGAIQRNLTVAVTTRLRGSACHFYGSDVKVLSADSVRYPDGQVICGPVPEHGAFTTGPVVLFEVVSPGSERVDHIVKPVEYLRIQTVQRYVVLEQDRVAITVMTRMGQYWAVEEVTGGVISLPEIGIEIPLSELYEA